MSATDNASKQQQQQSDDVVMEAAADTRRTRGRANGRSSNSRSNRKSAIRTAAQQRALLQELKSLMHDERMEEGDSWFLVAIEWWDKHIRMDDSGMNDNDDMDMDAHCSTEPVTNVSLVDLDYSSQERKTVVLKPMLAEGRDYRLVSESVWNRLSHEFSCDWEIPREVIESGPTHALRVEVYPTMFQVFWWQHSMDAPEVVRLPPTDALLVVTASDAAPLLDVQQQLYHALQSRLQALVRPAAPTSNKSSLSTADVTRVVRVSYRVAADAPWIALDDAAVTATVPTPATDSKPVGFESAATHTDGTQQQQRIALQSTTVRSLDLETRDYREGTARFHDLLVETRFSNTEDPHDWRNGQFYSAIQANAWRYALAIGDLVDACDSDHKWYESRVIALDDKSVKVHYRGWTAKWDEWLVRKSDRLALLHTKVRNWRAFRVHDSVQVGYPVAGKAYNEWKDGIVTEVMRSSSNSSDALATGEMTASETTTDDICPDSDTEADVTTTCSSNTKIQISIDGKSEWRDVQDELLCPPGTHKASNAMKSTAAVGAPLGSSNPTFSYASAHNRYNYSNSYSYSRPISKPDVVGVVGLQNLGNTCFLNSMLQCLINTRALKTYFLALDPTDANNTPLFEREINRENPLGMKGFIALEFADLVRKMWSGDYATVAPTKLKAVIGRYAPQFAGYQQQDSQEVMNFLLDGLHEDLNRVKVKPYLPAIEPNGRSDVEVAADEWSAYRKRNDSVIVDHFMGQLRSHLTCANAACGHESVTFDPFMSLSVPIPNNAAVKTTLQVQLFWADGRIPMKYAIQLTSEHATNTLRDVKRKLSRLSAIPVARLFFVEVWKHRILKALSDAKAMDEWPLETLLHAYELEQPVTEYEFSSKSIHPPPAAAASTTTTTPRLSLKIGPLPLAATTASADPSRAKAMRLVALLHQAPSATLVDDTDNLENDESSAKQRRVELELFNTPLLVSIPQHATKAQVHAKVWQVVKRLVACKSATDSDRMDGNVDAFGCGIDQRLPYRLHVKQPNGATSIIQDLERSDEPANLPDPNDRTHCFTVEWSRRGYSHNHGYDESSAKRIALHESMKQLELTDETINKSTKRDDVDLLQCLSKFTEREQLGETDTWYCPKCNDHVRAIKKFDLFALPRILIFQLKRFRYAQSSFSLHRDKIATLVTFPIANLDLSTHVVGPQRGTSLIYDLFAVSEHSGGLGGGHYTAVAKHPENDRWYSFNDSFTSETTAEKAVTPRAYVLFYVRREDEGA